MAALLDVDVIDVFRVGLRRQILIGEGPQYLDEDKLRNAGKMREPVDVSFGQPNFSEREAGTNGYKQLLDYFYMSTPNQCVFKEKFDTDFVSNPNTLELFGKWKFSHFPRTIQVIAYRKFGVIFLKIKEPIHTFDIRVSDAASNFKYYVTLDDNGSPRDMQKLGSEPIRPARSFSVLRASFSEDEQPPITVVYQSMVDALDSRNNNVRILISRERKVNNKKVTHYLSARLANAKFCLYGLRALGTTNHDANHQTVSKYLKVSTSGLPANATKVPWTTWTATSVMHNIYVVLAEIKERLTNDGDSLVLQVTAQGVEFLEEQETVDPAELLTDQLIRHFR